MYAEGMLIRYLVMRPKYSHLLKEICLNDIHPLTTTHWEKQILPSVKTEYEKMHIFSESTDQRFGIQEGESIGVRHLISIFLFTNHSFAEYRSFFSKSYYLLEQHIHINNFFWIGRYLFEAVKFYGQRFSHENHAPFYEVIQGIKTIHSLAPTFNAPLFTVSNFEYANKIAADKGIIYSLAPKYYGDIDTSKFLDVSSLFSNSQNIRIIMGGKLQLRSMRLMNRNEEFGTFVLSVQYLEKLLLQTVFDASFYNADELYDNLNMKRAHLLIMDKIGQKQNDVPQQARNLFCNWCDKREFITFETFQLEMHHMNYKLREFLFDNSTKTMKIKNVKKFLPKLKYFNDVDGTLRSISDNISLTVMNTIEIDATMSYYTEVKGVLDLVVNALEQIKFKFEGCKGVLREAFRMELSKLDINIESFHSNSEYFTDQLISIGLSKVVAQYCISTVKKDPSVNTRTKTAKFIELILNQLDMQKYHGVSCDLFSQKKAFQKLYSDVLRKFQSAVEKRDRVTVENLQNVAASIYTTIQTSDEKKQTKYRLFNDQTVYKLSTYLYIKMMDDKEKVLPWECQTCQFLNCSLMVNGL
eukprot:31739_1